MSLSYSIIEYDYSARVTITGLNTVYSDKTFYIYLDNFSTPMQTISTPVSYGEWDYTYTSLSPGTEYHFKIVCEYNTGTGIDAWDGTVEDYFTTTGGGGGGGGSEDDEWTYDDGYTLGEISQTITNEPYRLYSMETICISFYLSDDADVEFVSSGGVDIEGYITDVKRFDNSTGRPVDAYIYPYTGESGFNRTEFDFTVSGLTGGTTYYLWLKGYTDRDVGLTYISIIPTFSGVVPSTDGGVYIYNYYSNSWQSATPYIYNYYSNSWEKATPYIYNYYSNSWEKANK